MTDDYIPDDFSEDELYERIDYFLLNFGTDRSLLCVSELDGFFTALGCSAANMQPDFWVPAIWGADEDQPVWDDVEQEDEFLSLILIMYIDTMETIISGEISPIYLEQALDDGPDIHERERDVLVEEWCTGFMRGVQLTGITHGHDKVFIDDVLAPIRLFGTEAGWEKLNEMGPEEIQFWKELIEPCVIRLAHANHPEIPYPDMAPRILH